MVDGVPNEIPCMFGPGKATPGGCRRLNDLKSCVEFIFLFVSSAQGAWEIGLTSSLCAWAWQTCGPKAEEPHS